MSQPIVLSPIPGTGISVVTNELWSLRLFYQLLDGHIEQSRHLNGVWTNEQLVFSPVEDTPIASITYNKGKEIRVYYLDKDYMVQEYCYTEGKNWYPGVINQLKAKATPAAGLAAIAYGSDVLGAGEKGVHIRVYYQEAGSNIVKELANDGSWHTGDMQITDALGATNLAAVSYYFQNQTQIRVYYQDRNLFLKEHGHNNSGWFPGAFNPGKATARTPLSALAFGNVELQVYYRNLKGQVVFTRNTGSWINPIVIEPLGPGYNFAALEWKNGSLLRLYYQQFSGVITELCSDDAGKSWFPGKLQVGK
jgi:hypothetical protein